MVLKTKVKTLQELLDLRAQGNEVVYENYLSTGVVRRANHEDNAYVIVVKHDQNCGVNNLSTFKFYNNKPNEIHLSGFYYNKEIPDCEEKK
jgi:hypothetical protein